MTDDADSPASRPSGAPAGLSRSRTTRSSMPSGVLEVLRLLVVVFFAGAGFQLGNAVGDSRPVLGALNGTALGLVLGSGIGYVLGGVLGRSTAAGADEVNARLRAVSADQLLAGAFGTVAGVLVGAGVAWPAFFLRPSYLAFPLFGFVVVVLGYLGFQLGMSKREGVLALVGGGQSRPVAASALPRVLDTSVAVDGRVLDIVRAGFLHGEVLVPAPVLAELQGLADAGDDLRRTRGRRGLELLEALRREPGVDLKVLDLDVPGVHEVDAKLVRICLDRGTALLTLDTNLARAASLAGVQVLNLHALALALRPPVAAGDEVPVLLLKAGKEPGQAVGYLDDGSMVVVERARDRLGAEVPVLVTSVLTTANGRLVFGRPTDRPEDERARAEPRPAAPRPAPPRPGRPTPASVPPRPPA